MNLLSRILRPRDDQRAITHQSWGLPFASFFSSGPGDAGISVTESNALTASAVWSCVQIIANAISTLPRHLQDRETGQKKYDHPLYAILANEPNEYMTAATFWNAVMTNLLLWGNAFAFIDRDPETQRPRGIFPLKSSGTYRTRYANGADAYVTTIGGQQHTLRPHEVYHVMGLTLDGFTGLSPIQYARQTIGLSLATEKFAAKFFSNGGHLGGVLEMPANMNPQAKEHFLEQWKKNYTGAENAMKTAMLLPGMKYNATGTDPEKGQMLGTRVHQRREIAAVFRVPLHMVGDTEKASYASIEVQNLEFHQQAVQPWVTALEAEANRKLLLEVEKPKLELKFNMDSRLRASTNERYDAHGKAITGGFMTPNEARRFENLPPLQGGDQLRLPLNTEAGDAAAAKGKQGDTGTRHHLPLAVAHELVTDAARRLVTKEARSIERAAKKFQGKPDEFRSWADQFYAEHRTLTVQAMAVSLKASGTSTTPEQYATRYCTGHLELLKRALTEEWTAEQLVDWIESRPAELAAEVFTTQERDAA